MKSETRHNLNLLFVLSRAHFKLSDYRSVLGVFWSFLGPLLTFLVIYFIFVDRLGQNVPHFTIRLLVGVVVVNFFTNTVGHAMQVIKQERHILINTPTPAEIPLLSVLFVPWIKFAVELSLCAAVALYLGTLSWLSVMLLPLVYLLFIGMSLGTGMILAVLYCLAGDVSEIWQAVAGRLLLFVTPIFYSLDMLSPWARAIILNLNPITPFALIFQSLLSGQTVAYCTPFTVIQALAYTAGFMLIGYFALKKTEKHIVESL